MSDDSPRLPEDLAREREQVIAELESKLARPARVGVQPFVAGLALCGAFALLWMQRADSAYFASEREPISLGAEGDYRFERALHNRYVTLHGTPTTRGAYAMDGAHAVVALGARDTPVMLWRPALPSEHWEPGTVPPRPDQRPFTVRGRLFERSQAPARYADAFEKLDSYGEVNAKWVLVEGQRPGGDWGSMIWLGGLLAFAAVNAWLLMRGVVALRKS